MCDSEVLCCSYLYKVISVWHEIDHMKEIISDVFFFFLHADSASFIAICAGSGPFQRWAHTLNLSPRYPLFAADSESQEIASSLALLWPFKAPTWAPFGLSWPLGPCWCLYPLSSSRQQARCSSVMPLIKKKLPIPTVMQGEWTQQGGTAIIHLF